MSLRTFAGEVLADFQTTAAIAPSSNSLVQAMLEPLPLRTAKVVVELGPGTGVMTRALLDRMPQNAVLFAFEINPRFFRYLSGTSSDPRLHLINASAETLEEEFRRRGTKRVDAVVSSLGLSLMPDQQRHAILGGLLPFMTLIHFRMGAGVRAVASDVRGALRDLLHKGYDSVCP